MVLWVRSWRGVRLRRSTLGSFRQTERGAGAVGEGATGAARVWLTISLSPCIMLRRSPCGPSGFIWASSQHGGLRILRLLTWLPRVSKQVSQLVSKKLNHPLRKPHRVSQSLPNFKGSGHRPHLLTGEILLEPLENTIWLKGLFKQQQSRLLSINSVSILPQVIEHLRGKKAN